MKVIIAYPPLANEKGHPTLGQNRQFQYFKDPTYIYPVVPAQGATLLKRAGHEVVWLDAIARGFTVEDFMTILSQENADVIAFETKTPVVKQHWKFIELIKTRGLKGKIVLFGDHVTALPEESFLNSKVDFVLTGGDYDFLLLNLCETLASLSSDKALIPAESLEHGIYYRDNGILKNTGHFRLDHDLNEIPFIDRELTQWPLYSASNGNYKRTPGTYIMSGRDCWYHKCTFCSWPTLYPQHRTRSVENVVHEVCNLIERYQIREIMDDAGCFPVGYWLKAFCESMIKSECNKKVYFDCNMRFGALSKDDFKLMKKANFRLLLFGLESANQMTLDRINKGVKVESIIEDCKRARAAGLFPHITLMFGYPWETYEDASKTLKLGQWLLKKGYAYTMQATVMIPYPGTPLFEECKRHGWIKSFDWDAYDMKQPVMRTSMPDETIMKFAQSMYEVSFSPQFILRKLLSLRDLDDVRYALRAARKVFGHVFDFGRKEKCPESRGA